MNINLPSFFGFVLALILILVLLWLVGHRVTV